MSALTRCLMQRSLVQYLQGCLDHGLRPLLAQRLQVRHHIACGHSGQGTIHSCFEQVNIDVRLLQVPARWLYLIQH